MPIKPARLSTLLLLSVGCLATLIPLGGCSDDGSASTSLRGTRRTGTTGGNSSSGGSVTDGDNEGASGRTTPGTGLAPATGAGGGGGGGRGTVPAGDTGGAPRTNPTGSGKLALVVGNGSPVAMNLQENKDIPVEITGSGLSGPVQLSVGSTPTGATATISPSTVDLSSGKATATLSFKAGSAAPGSSNVEVKAVAGDVSQAGTAAVTLNPKLVIKIPQNANANTKNFDVIPVSKGTGNLAVVFENPTSDTVTIHRSDNGKGFSHGGPIAPGASETRNVTGTGNLRFYVHNGKDQANPGTLQVQ